MPINTTDPGEVRVVGENPVMYLYEGADPVPSTSLNFWKARLSPVGSGSALFLHGELTAGEPRIFADNIALARFLQAEIIRQGQPYKSSDIPVIEAVFSETWALPSHLTATVTAGSDQLTAGWFELAPAMAGHAAPDEGQGGTDGHYAIYVPARRVELKLNEVTASGTTRPLMRDGRDINSAFVALAESWQRYG